MLTRLFSRTNGSEQRNGNITIFEDYILLNGKSLHILSGELHYFRVPWEYWEDRLCKLKAAGLNTVSTYVEWSFHEPEERLYSFAGDRNVSQFIRTAGDLGLYVLLRPGPYICAERDFGGLPYWLLSKYPYINLRSQNQEFMMETRIWMKKLFKQLSPYLFGNGGPVIMIQVENGYGSLSNNKSYMRRLRDIISTYVDHNALLYTADGSAYFYKEGSIEGALPTLNMGADTENISEYLEPLYNFTNGGPLMNSEFYVGWLTLWSAPYTAVIYTSTIINTLKQILRYKRAVHINFYMFCGGSNFEVSSGALEHNGMYLPVATTYDYDAPISEFGNLTPKYYAIRKVLEKYRPKIATIPVPPPTMTAEYGTVKLRPCLKLFSDKGRRIMGKKYSDVEGPLLPTFEQLRQRIGLMLYETTIDVVMTSAVNVQIEKPRDRVYVYVNGMLRGIADRMTRETEITVGPIAMSTIRLSFLVENQGRLNQKISMNSEFKGILSPVLWDDKILSGKWSVTGFPLTTRRKSCELFNDIYYKSLLKRGPVVYVARFTLPRGMKPLDTFFYPTGWGKGYVWVNGRNLGRYWPSAGPQITLYLPAVWLRAAPAQNIILLLELERAPQNLTVEFINHPLNY
ncbi:beta-galactosidase-like [Hyposmocoma kahamanoa]|uniref:beta-galactosidase-like n=1 Tax=Hyposmocoma kahamanoa TaxID=1477025 RepID=UPI000E6D8363|nr:beta-galactosidase-like [Hyposmocoma kahamanoa]